MRILNNGTLLTKKHFSDAGLDVPSYEDVIIPARGSAIISTNLFVAIDKGYVGMLCSRSGLSVKHKIEVGAGIIDSAYRGEVKVHLFNHSDEPFQVNKGDRIAQLLTIPVMLGYYTLSDSLESTERDLDGFGASGGFGGNTDEHTK